MEIYIRKIENGFLVEDYVNKKIWHESTAQSACNRLQIILIKNDIGESVKKESSVEFDPLPSDLPPPPDGFVYFGEKPIYANRLIPVDSIMTISESEAWTSPSLGDCVGFHYAVRIGSQAHKDAIEAQTTGQPV